MTSRDHERFRRQLEKQLREDVELLYAGYTAKLRAYEMLHALPGRATPSVCCRPVSRSPWRRPLPAVPRDAPRRQHPSRRLHRRREPRPRALLRPLGCAWRSSRPLRPHDVEAALGFSPRRASLYRVLGELATKAASRS